MTNFHFAKNENRDNNAFLEKEKSNNQFIKKKLFFICFCDTFFPLSSKSLSTDS